MEFNFSEIVEYWKLSNVSATKYCSCHSQGECVLVGWSWLSVIGQGVSGALDVMAVFAEMLHNSQYLIDLYPKAEVLYWVPTAKT